MSLWIGLGGFVATALLLMLWPLWRQRAELAGGSGALRWQILGVSAAVPALTLGLYLHLGAPAILKEQALIQAQTSYDVDGMVKALEDKLKAAPNDPEGWYALGRAYIAMARHADAEQVLGKAAAQAPQDARILAQYAEAMALKQGSLDGRPMELIQQALEISYEETKALELAGLNAFQKENWAQALHYWRRLLKLLPKDTEHHEAIAQGILTAERRLDLRLGGTGMPAAPPAPAEPRKSPH